MSVPLSLFTRVKEALLYEPPIGQSPPLYLFFKNRYVRLCVFQLMCLCNCLVYFGWQPYSTMLYRAGAYRWECVEPLKTPDSFCLVQDNQVQTLFQVGLCAEFICGVLAGLSYDYLGSFITGAMGCCCYFTGWMLLAYSSQSAPLYIPAMIFQAGAVNLIGFPCLAVADHFPKRPGLIVSLIIAFQCAGTFVAAVMVLVWDRFPSYSFSHIVWGYLCYSFFPISALYLLCLPWRRPAVVKSVVVDELPEKTTEFVSLTSVSIETQETSPGKASDDQSTTEAPDLPALMADDDSAIPLWKQFFSTDYVLFTLYFVLQCTQFGYYPTTVKTEYGEDVSYFLGFLLPTQGVFGALFGLIVDHTSTLPICILLTSMMTLGYITALIRNTGLQYFTSVLYVVSNSYIYTAKCTYVAELFPRSHFGKLIGVMGCVAGVVGLLNIVIQNANQYKITCIGYMCVGIVALAIVVFLLYRKTSRKRKRLSEVENQPISESKESDPTEDAMKGSNLGITEEKSIYKCLTDGPVGNEENGSNV